MIAARGGYEGYYVSFCGYFPSDNPKYTCFVGIRRPQGIPSGGLMPGAVFKTIAEGIYTRNTVATPILAQKDTVNSLIPIVKSGSFKNTEIVLKKLKQDYNYSGDKVDWVNTDSSINGILLQSNSSIKQGLVPNVIGMGARDAIYLLELEELKVNLIGAGKVKQQSIAPGTRTTKGATITIELN